MKSFEAYKTLSKYLYSSFQERRMHALLLLELLYFTGKLEPTCLSTRMLKHVSLYMVTIYENYERKCRQ